MREFSLNKEPDLIVTARFIKKGDDKSLTGEDYTVRLYDRDITDDDYLGQSRLDDEGRIRIEFSHDAFVNDAVFKEAKPDFFFVIMRKNQPVYTSKVMEEINIEDLEQFKMGQGELVDLGTFLVDVN